MRHLSDEILARLVDEPPTDAQREHLATCDRCAGTLEELRVQTEALSSLPALRPPPGDWEELEARLVRRGLVGSAGMAESGASSGSERPGSPYTGSAWLQVAAALVLFLGGTAFGSWIGPGGSTGAGSEAAGDPSARVATETATGETGSLADGGGPGSTPATAAGGTRVDEAELQLRAAEERYVEALVTYRQMLRDSDVGGRTGDGSMGSESPAARVAALEALVAASQEAIRHAPADPFFNGVLASTMAERQAAIRQISTSGDDSWF